MRTLQECKDQIAKDNGHADWEVLMYRCHSSNVISLYDQAAMLYASEACREQREICAKAYWNNDMGNTDNSKSSIHREIQIAPLPEMK
jgi:hypothetical protein